VAHPAESAAPIRIDGTDGRGTRRIARAFFEQQGITYDGIDPDVDREAAAFVFHVNNGLRSVPTIVLPDGSLLVEPSLSALARKPGSVPSG